MFLLGKNYVKKYAIYIQYNIEQLYLIETDRL
jgi:hypothetical protein